MIDLASEASAIHSLANESYFAVLLSSLQLSADKHGFEFGRDGTQHILTPDEEDTLGASIVAARRLYLTPKVDEFAHQGAVDLDIADGYAASWLRNILAALAQRGVYLRKKMSLSGGGPEADYEMNFVQLVVGRALQKIDDIEQATSRDTLGHTFGLALGYQIALGELGIISGALRLELVQKAESVFNMHHLHIPSDARWLKRHLDATRIDIKTMSDAEIVSACPGWAFYAESEEKTAVLIKEIRTLDAKGEFSITCR